MNAYARMHWKRSKYRYLVIPTMAHSHGNVNKRNFTNNPIIFCVNEIDLLNTISRCYILNALNYTHSHTHTYIKWQKQILHMP